LDFVSRKIDPRVVVAAQNVSMTTNGAFTGEISAEMLTDASLQSVLIGHSERRTRYGETDASVTEKIKRAQGAGMNVIACCGETQQERNQKATEKVVTTQMQAIIAGVADWKRVVIAYEPVWAIGTGVTATPEQAEEVHACIRKLLPKESNPGSVRIIYGGSVTAANCASLIKETNVDGFLVGGASLKAPDFLTIINSGVTASK